MKKIKSIDLWTEQYDNHLECFSGAFVDGFENNATPFDEYKIIKNCNCIITSDKNYINIRNKNNAIVFYKNSYPMRLMVVNRDTNIEKCIDYAISQVFNDKKLKELYNELNIKNKVVDMKESSINNDVDSAKELDVGSCDRWSLLTNLLQGIYTESESDIGNFSGNKYYFIPNINIKYELKTDEEEFEIIHNCAFINDKKTRIIPIQKNSLLVLENNQKDYS